jgi:hypothetical protein
MLHLYALVQRPVKLARADGIDGSELRTAALSRDVDAVVSEIPETQPSEAAILAHAAVVEQLTDLNEAVLPARFGGGYQSDEALAEAIKGREEPVREALQRVRGCVEIGLRVFDQAPEVDDEPHGSGHAYMRGRLEELRRAERTAAELHDSLSARARASTSSVLASPQLLLTSSYLLPRAEVEPFRLEVERMERNRRGLTFVCTGPWPPYSFAMIDAEGGP